MKAIIEIKGNGYCSEFFPIIDNSLLEKTLKERGIDTNSLIDNGISLSLNNFNGVYSDSPIKIGVITDCLLVVNEEGIIINRLLGADINDSAYIKSQLEYDAPHIVNWGKANGFVVWFEIELGDNVFDPNKLKLITNNEQQYLPIGYLVDKIEYDGQIIYCDWYDKGEELDSLSLFRPY